MASGDRKVTDLVEIVTTDYLASAQAWARLTRTQTVSSFPVSEFLYSRQTFDDHSLTCQEIRSEGR